MKRYLAKSLWAWLWIMGLWSAYALSMGPALLLVKHQLVSLEKFNFVYWPVWLVVKQNQFLWHLHAVYLDWWWPTPA